MDIPSKCICHHPHCHQWLYPCLSSREQNRGPRQVSLSFKSIVGFSFKRQSIQYIRSLKEKTTTLTLSPFFVKDSISIERGCTAFFF